MKTIVAGPRHITDREVVRAAMNSCPWDITTVISGRARGVDTIGEELANAANVTLALFPANWKRFGNSAGPKRNTEMASYADALIAIWDQTVKSRGTRSMIDIAYKAGLRIRVHYLNGHIVDHDPATQDSTVEVVGQTLITPEPRPVREVLAMVGIGAFS